MMVPTGGTPMRYGIYKSINEIKSRGRQSAVKAVIVLSDGDYNGLWRSACEGNRINHK